MTTLSRRAWRAIWFPLTMAFLVPAAVGRSADEPRSTVLPDTPVGRIARRFVEAVNAEKRAVSETFVRECFTEDALKQTPATAQVAWLERLRAQSGGLDVMRVPSDQPVDRMSFFARSKRGHHWVRVFLGSNGQNPPRTDGIGLIPVEDPAEEKKQAWPTGRLNERQIVRAIRERVARRSARDQFSGVVLVAKGSRVLLETACGMADRNMGVPNRIETRFHLGSMGKMFTSIAIAQLVRDGKLRYEDTLACVLSDYPNPEAARKITIEHLLTHQAGLGGLFDEPKYDRRARYQTQADYLPVFAMNPLNFEPGTRWGYSNEGFVMLGAVIERVSGQNYVDYVREHIFRPLGMNDTDNYALDEVTPNLAVGYMRYEDDDPLGIGPRRPNHMFLGWRGNGCGGCYSTAHDLLKFALALRDNRIFAKEWTEKITSGRVKIAKGTMYGYGFMATQVGGKEVRGHSGGGPNSGINSDMETFWDGSYTVITLGNYDAPAAQDLNRSICEFLAAQSR